MERRNHPDLRALLQMLDSQIAKCDGPVDALLEERARLLAEIDIWRRVGRRAGDRLPLDWAS